MEVVTYIIDAPTLINNINALKQWVYSGSIRILVPLTVLNQVEEQYRISIAPKEPVKEHHARKSWGKAPRKEQPLFDINPRIAWEFLSRIRSEKEELRILFQGEEEKFTQWEKKQEEVAKPETPPPPPTSFASALLRKLNIQDISDTNGTKGPTKPKLVARSGDSKAPWTYHKVPTISDSSVPGNLKSLLSCLLWRIHEFQRNPIGPETFALLSDDSNTRSIANDLDIVSRPSFELRHLIDQVARSFDKRLESGELENNIIIPSEKWKRILAKSTPAAQEPITNGHASAPTSEQSTAPDKPANLRETFESQKNVNHPRESIPLFQSHGPPASPKSSALPHTHPEKSSAQAPIGTGRLRAPKDILSAAEKDTLAGTTSLLDSLMQGSSPDVPDQPTATSDERPKSISPIGERVKSQEESEVDSDEEVIVFNPRARRTSGRSRTPAGPPKSRPTTSHSHTASNDGLKPARSPIVSSLKPQSPVFTPGQAYVSPTNAVQDQQTKLTQPVQQDHQGQQSPATQPPLPIPPTKPAQDRKANVSPPAISSPARSPQPRSATPRRPRADLQQRHPSHDHLQHQSRMIIQRQREAIERQVKAAAKPPPRQVQLEPTENPTVIDPDAFDRSYVVQHSAGSPTPTNGKMGSGTRGGRRRSPKGKESPKQVARKPSDKPSPTEPEVDFVLKSGQPRGSMRGKGKLWIP